MCSPMVIAFNGLSNSRFLQSSFFLILKDFEIKLLKTILNFESKRISNFKHRIFLEGLILEKNEHTSENRDEYQTHNIA